MWDVIYPPVGCSSNTTTQPFVRYGLWRRSVYGLGRSPEFLGNPHIHPEHTPPQLLQLTVNFSSGCRTVERNVVLSNIQIPSLNSTQEIGEERSEE